MAGLPSWMDGCFYPSPRGKKKCQLFSFSVSSFVFLILCWPFLPFHHHPVGSRLSFVHRTTYCCIITPVSRPWKTDTATPEAKTTWSVSCSATTISTITDYSKHKSCPRYHTIHIDPPPIELLHPPHFFFFSPFHSWHYSNDTRQQSSRFPKQLRDD